METFRLDRSGTGRLVAAGPEAAAFLQRILTQDIDALVEGSGAESFFLTAKGRYVAFLTLYHRGDHFLVKCPGEVREELARKLSMFTLGSEADVSDATEVLDLVTVLGDGAASALSAAAGQAPPEELHANAMLPIGGYAVTACRTDDFGVPGWDLHFPAAIRDAVDSALGDVGELDPARAEVLRIEAGIARHGAEMDEKLLPPEIPALVPRAISYSKGCYVGQETIARIKTYGHVNRELRGLVVKGDAPPAPGTELTVEGKKVGAITSSCVSESAGGPIALGFVKRQHFEPGTELDLAIDGESTTASVVPAGGPWK
ncbi:MAG: glycine cleavage T C-terminal barrel domain-containing protein [Planctomycetota bacterium]